MGQRRNREIRKHFEVNVDENVSKVAGHTSAVIGRECITLDASVINEMFLDSVLSSALRNYKRKNSTQRSIRKERIPIRAEISRKQKLKKINETKTQFFEKIHKIGT